MDSEKRSASLSSTFHDVKKSENAPKLQRHRSQVAKDHIEQLESGEENTIRSMINESIERVNKQNMGQNNNESRWEMTLCDEKKQLKGIKSRVKWKHDRYGVWIITRFIFTANYIQYRQFVNEGDIIIELDETNIDLSLKQQRKLQQSLNQNLQSTIDTIMERRDEFLQEQQLKSTWLYQMLVENQNLYKQFMLSTKPKLKTGTKVKKERVNGNYVLYHSPVVLAWSPQSTYCLTENKIPQFRKPYICNKTSFKETLGVQRKQEGYNIIKIKEEDQILHEEETTPETYYTWDLMEDFDFVTSQTRDNLEYEEKNSHRGHKDGKESRKAKKVNTEVLAYLNRIPPQIRKIYVNYFDPNQYTEKFHRQDKLKVFSVKNELILKQTELLYIIHRINSDKHRKVSQIILQNEFSGYSSSLIAGNIDEFKYFVIRSFLNEEEARIDSITFRMKAIILQNEHFHTQLQKYLIKAYNLINVLPGSKITSLGSYQHFDFAKSEQLFMDLLKNYYKNSDKKQDITVHPSNKSNNKEIFIRIKSKFSLPSLKINWLLTQKQRMVFLQTLIPIIWVRDQNYLKFQYKQIARIIATNSQILKFLSTMNGIVLKLRNGRFMFIDQILKNYEIHREKMSAKETYSRRSFSVECHLCKKINSTFELSQVSRLATCQRCKVNNT